MGVYRPPSYVYSLPDQIGSTTAYNFLSIMNPVGSNTVIVLGALFVSAYSVGNATATAPLRGWRISQSTGGTQVPTSDICKFRTTSTDAVAEIRTGNPAVVLGPALFNVPPPIGTGAGTPTVTDVTIPPASEPFLLFPGEGIVTRTDSGDIDQHFNVSIVWVERKP